MKPSPSSSIRYLLHPQKASTISHPAIIDQRAEKAYLIQKIELLQMQNEELRRRDENNKKINLALTEAISKSEYQPEDIRKLLTGLFESKTKEQTIKQSTEQCTQTETVYTPSVHFQGLTLSRQHQPNPQSFKFQHTIKDSLKNSSYYQDQDNQRNYHDYTDNLQYRFSKTPHANLNISAFINQNYATPIRDKRATPKKKTFQRTLLYLQGPATHRSSIKSMRGKNVATDLLCDICGVSFSPMVFLSHVQECDGGENSQEESLRKITDADFSEEEEEDGSDELVQLLESRKKKLSAQIEKLKRMRGSPEKKKRLETDLDQIVFIIKNKKTLNNSDIKKLLKQKSYYEKCFR